MYAFEGTEEGHALEIKFEEGDTIGLFADRENNRLSVYVNGEHQKFPGGQHKELSTGTLVPIISARHDTAFTMNLWGEDGGWPFKYPPTDLIHKEQKWKRAHRPPNSRTARALGRGIEELERWG